MGRPLDEAGRRSGPVGRRALTRAAAAALLRGFVFAFFAIAAARPAAAQQPFLTDDTEVTPAHEFHFEYANSYVALSRNANPDLRQDTNNFVIQFGLLNNLEANVDFPLIYIARDRGSQVGSAFGLGDVDFGLKWKLVSETPGEPHPGFTVSGFAELPTGNVSKQLGSGFTDYSVNTILQKSVTETFVLHVNAGLQFSGNTLTGAVGIRTPGRIYSAGISAAKEVSPTLKLGIDLNGAEIHTSSSLDRQLQLTVGGNLEIAKGHSFDFAVLAGWSSAPRIGLLLGISLTP
ncbi:MAG TPA: transporter [Thermoanaerobaculia bacterium]|nr:transporter [Thermoanaerobaculia bacterium]